MTDRRRAPRRRPFAQLAKGLALAALLLALAAGCAGARFESNPPGAIIEYSITGAEPWIAIDVDSSTGEPRRAPFSSIKPLSGYVFVRARLAGHLPSERRLVNFSELGRESILFELRRTAEFEALAKLDAGLAYVDGRWVDPAVEGLVRRDGAWLSPDEAERRDQLAAGNVFVDGAWIPAAVAEERERERLLAKGHVEYKGRLVSPDEALRMGGIDRQIAALAKRAGEDAAHPASDNAYLESTGRMREGSRLKLFNATSLQAEFLVSGAREALSISVAPYDDQIATLPPGAYDVAALPVVEGSYRPYLGQVELRETYAYTLIYVGLDAEQRDLEALARRAAESPPNLAVPEITIPEMPESEPSASDSREGEGGAGGGPRRGGRGGGARGGRR